MQQIVVFPYWGGSNPYLNLLYLSATMADWRVVATSSLDQLESALNKSRPGDLLHIHWTSPVCQAQPSRHAAKQSLNRFRKTVLEAIGRGIRLIWTVHNVIPHETAYEDLEKELSQFIADHAWRVIQLNRSTRDVVSPYFSLDAQRLVTIPHASYAGLYPDISQPQAREHLGIPRDHHVVGFIGQIRAYKGITVLLRAVEQLAKTRGNLTLLLGGKASAEDRAALEASLTPSINVVISEGHIPDDELGHWVAACDVMALPYRRILNSGSLLLCATMARPVALPNDPHLVAEYGDQQWISFYDRSTDEVEALAVALDSAFDDWATKSAAARQFAAQYTPLDMSNDYLSLITEAFAS